MKTILATFAVCGLFAVSASALTIDTFDTTGQTLSTNNTGGNIVLAPEAVGGERDITGTVTFGGGGSEYLDVTVNSVANPNIYAHSQGTGLIGTSVLAYDGADADAGNLDVLGLGGVDLTDAGAQTGFKFGYKSDLTLNFTVTVYTDSGNWSTKSISLGGGIGDLDPWVNVFVPFASLGGGSGTTDFTDVGAIVFTFQGINTGTDMKFDFFETNTPEPASMSLLGLGGLALIRRKR